MVHFLRQAPIILLDDSRQNGAGPSYLFTNPKEIISAHTLADLPDAFARMDAAYSAGLHLAGWVSYECAAYFEPRLAPAIAGQMEAHAAASKTSGGSGCGVSGSGVDVSEPLLWLMAVAEKDVLSAGELEDALVRAEGGNARSYALNLAAQDGEENWWNTAFNAVQDHIASGNVYQINLTFARSGTFEGDTLALYSRLRKSQPVPFSAYIDTGTHTLLSHSPELFFALDADQTNTPRLHCRPMKGTAPRGRTHSDDTAAAAALKSDSKNRAENLMIVDLIRNDLSRIAAPKSVKVDSLFDIETYPSVLQMTSSVSATAAPDLLPSEALRALFPCGSVTGAPKIMAQSIITELERHPRGAYCGAIGYFSPPSKTQPARWCLNVPIRTLIVGTAHAPNGTTDHQITQTHAPYAPRSEEARFTSYLSHSTQTDSPVRPVRPVRLQVGAGLVADSQADEEARECALKASFASNPRPDFDLIESLRLTVVGGKADAPFLSAHIARLTDSSAYMGMPFDAGALKTLLTAHTKGLADGTYKLRVTLNAAGSLALSSEPIANRAFHTSIATTDQQSIEGNTEHTPQYTLTCALDPVCSTDVFLYHKTTHRALYKRGLMLAQENGFDDCVFVNENGDICETAICNILLQDEAGGPWVTPAASSGLLAGVMRAHLLDTGQVRAEIVSFERLAQAHAVCVCNAVRGIVPALFTPTRLLLYHGRHAQDYGQKPKNAL